MVGGVARDGPQGRFTHLGCDLNRYTKLQSRLILNITEGLKKRAWFPRRLSFLEAAMGPVRVSLHTSLPSGFTLKHLHF